MADFHFINAIWDFDGTLFNTYPGLLKALSKTLTGIVTASDRFPRKPDPTAINALVEHYGLDPQVTVMIGDRAIDVEAGQKVVD